MANAQYEDTIIPNYDKYRQEFIRTTPFNNYVDKLKSLDEPTYIGFKILFHFNDPYSPLLNLSTDKADNTALNYLRKNGYTKQEARLKDFITKLQYVSQRSEWYFQKIEGLDQIIGWDFMASKVREDKQFTIDTLESLDMRINSIIDNYVLACFDVTNRRVIVPQNLRYFAMSIYITDLRDFAGNFYDIEDRKIGEFAHGLNDSATRPSLFYRLDLCEFDYKTKGSILSTLDNNGKEQLTNKLVINHFGEILEYPKYVLEEFVDSVTPADDSPQTILSTTKTKSLTDKIGSKMGNDFRVISDVVNDGSVALNDIKGMFADKEYRIENALKQQYNSRLLNGVRDKLNNALEKTVLNGITDIENKLSGAIMPLFLGNVYNNDSKNTVRNVRNILETGLSFF